MGRQPPRLPGTGLADPYATRDQFSDTDRISTRDVQRTSGQTEGVWVATNSQAIDRMRYDPDYDLDGEKTGKGTIKIQYLSLAVWEFPDRPASDWMDLFSSSSKGRFNYYEIRSWTGREISPAKLKGKALSDKRKARAPVGERQQKRTYTRNGKQNAYGAGGRRVR